MGPLSDEDKERYHRNISRNKGFLKMT